MPNGAKVYIDMMNHGNNGNIYATCTFDTHILTCDKFSYSPSSNDLIEFQSEKVHGSVTWLNLRGKYISIPLTYSLPFTKAFGAFFTDKWSFLITSSYKESAAAHSKIIIDIIQNTQETTATCELLTQGQSSNNRYIYCISNLVGQTSEDTIEINPTKISGTATWTNDITEENKIVEKVSTSGSNSKELIFIDAYDMYFSNNKWFFTIISRTTSAIAEADGLLFKVDISVTKSSSSELITSTATCLLYDGIGYTSEVKFLCSCDYESQSKDDLIKLHYPKTESSTITWSSGITSDYPIVLNTVLTIKEANTLKKDAQNIYWIFKVEIDRTESTILPLNSKVTVDISQSGYLANCTVDSANILSCVSNCRTTEPNLVYYKSTSSSVTWTNEETEIYWILREATVALLSVNYLYFKENKWRFNISTNLGYSKVIIDVTYNGAKSTATCFGFKNYILNCEVNKESQSKTDSVQLSSTKPEGGISTVTWTNVNKDLDIPLWTELTLKNANNLHTGSGTWVFEIYRRR